MGDLDGDGAPDLALANGTFMPYYYSFNDNVAVLMNRTGSCQDLDGDGYGDPASTVCTYPERDCDDTDPAIHPGAPEIWGDGIDSNCNGQDLCYIATAAFGSRLNGKIDVLRAFRDRHLMVSRAGEALVEAYYRNSPAIAAVVEKTPWLKTTVRILLLPVIGLVSLFV